MTVSGDNDTSVAYGAVGGVPGDGEIPMETDRNCPSAVCPCSGRFEDKYEQYEIKNNSGRFIKAYGRCFTYLIKGKQK